MKQKNIVSKYSSLSPLKYTNVLAFSCIHAGICDASRTPNRTVLRHLLNMLPEFPALLLLSEQHSD